MFLKFTVFFIVYIYCLPPSLPQIPSTEICVDDNLVTAVNYMAAPAFFREISTKLGAQIKAM
jgi:hypothetical protein